MGPIQLSTDNTWTDVRTYYALYPLIYYLIKGWNATIKISFFNCQKAHVLSVSPTFLFYILYLSYFQQCMYSVLFKTKHKNKKWKCILTFVMGFILDSMINSYLQSSHFFVSELLIHLCRQLWCTYCKEPAHKQGEIKGWSGSASQWHILQISMDDTTDVVDKLFLAMGFGFSSLFSRFGTVIIPSEDFGFPFCICF